MILFTTDIFNLKSVIIYNFSHLFEKITVDFDNLPIQKGLTLHNVIIHIKSVQNKDKITVTIRYFQKNASQITKREK